MFSQYSNESVEESAINNYNSEDEFYCNFKMHQVSAYNHKNMQKDNTYAKQYFIINKDNECVRVTKKFFDTHKIFVKKIKCLDGVKYYSLRSKLAKETFNVKNYSPQFLITACRDIYQFFKDKIEFVRAISANYNNPHMNSFIIDFSCLMADMFGFKGMSAWLTILCRIYSLIIRFVDFRNAHRYERQSNIYDVSLGVAMMGMPREIVQKLQIFQSLATSKIVNSSLLVTLLRKFFNLIFDMINYIGRLYPENETLMSIKQFLEENFSFIVHLETADTVSELYTRYYKKPDIMQNIKFREEVLQVEGKLNNPDFLKFLCNPEFKHMKEIVNAFKFNIVKYAKTFTISSKVEPVCFMFEGIAGSGKSTMMNKLVELMKEDNKSVYTHIFPSIECAKDFYDDYENQDVMVVDDIGQQGTSQWRSIINFVSPVKVPLDCATAEKKNTKFFNSELILGTTNNLSNLQAFTDRDCISTPEALFRRIHLIQFKSTERYDLNYRKYDFKKDGTWKIQFIDSMKNCRMPLACQGEFHNEEDEDKIVVWVYSIIKYALEMNKKYSLQNTTSKQRLEGMLNKVNENIEEYFEAQMYSPPKRFSFNAGELTIDDNKSCETSYDGFSFKNKCEFYADSVKTILNNVYLSTETVFRFLVDKCKSFLAMTFEHITSGNLVVALVGLIFSVGLYWFFRNDTMSIQEELYEVQDKNGVNLDPIQGRIKEHTFVVKCMSQIDGVEVEHVAHCIISGNTILLNDHLVGENPVLNIYKTFTDLEKDNIMFNNLICKIETRLPEEDLCILKCDRFPITPIKKFKFNVNEAEVNIKGGDVMFVINPTLELPLYNRINSSVTKHMVKYQAGTKTYAMTAGQTISYPVSISGMCGSALIDKLGNIRGHHVCGNNNEGIIKIWSERTLKKIEAMFKDNTCSVVDYDLKDNNYSSYSGIRLFNTDLKPINGRGKSKIVQSDLFDIKDEAICNELTSLEMKGVIAPLVSKAPANLSVYGQKTTIELSKKSYKPIPYIKQEELVYVRECLESLMPPSFEKISLQEAVFGNADIRKINKDSANGYGYEKDKTLYIDFEAQVIKPLLEEKIESFKSAVLNNNLHPRDILCKEALKDELRTTEKIDKPRLFRVLPLHHTILVKQYLAELFVYLKQEMWNNGIAIGMNPYLDFEQLYNKLTVNKIIFDGDFGSYDGSAPSQLQDLIADVVLCRFQGSNEDKRILHVLLMSMIRSYVLTREQLTLTTHSMPSGCWVTALFNSLLNRCLTALCIIRNKRSASLHDFHSIVDFVLGDDKIVSVPARLGEVVNAVTMRKVAESLGMSYTDARKGDIVEPSKQIEECQFLKRTFRFNPMLQKIVGVLEMSTLIESLRYWSLDKTYEEVMNGKLTALQYELFLYGTQCKKLLKMIKEKARNEGISFIDFKEDVIMKTMMDKEMYSIMLSNLNKFDFINI